METTAETLAREPEELHEMVAFEGLVAALEGRDIAQSVEGMADSSDEGNGDMPSSAKRRPFGSKI